MKNKALLYSLVSIVTGVTFTGCLLLNQTKTQALTNNPSQLTQNQSPNNSFLAMGMMMNQDQIDQKFIQNMIPHHQGAVDMANLALTDAKHPQLKKLAEAIKTSQTKEISMMKEWYKKWYGVDVPKMNMNHQMPMNPNHNMDMMHMMDMMGMMNMDLTPLKNSPNFDLTFVDMMIPHHQMAVMMAAMVLNSPHPELRTLAKNIIQTQTAEIEEMVQWQKAWSK